MHTAKPESAQGSYTRAQELRTFLFLTVFMAPILAGVIIIVYGFLVWTFQLFAGPPGTL